MNNSKGHTWFARRDRLCLTAGALVALVALGLAGARPAEDPPSIEVGGISVLGGGRRRISMDSSAETGAVVALNNETGIPQLILTVRPNGEKGVFLADIAKGNNVTINLSPDGTAFMGLGSFTHSHLYLIAQKDGAVSLVFSDKNARARIKLGLQPDGSPGLEFFDEKGKRTPLGPSIKADDKPEPQNQRKAAK
jgi:hypothetical protein